MTSKSEPDWQNLLDSWDRQQQGYVPQRENLIGTMLDVTETVVGSAPLVLDLACGPGSVSARLLDHLPDARSVAADIDPVLLAIGQGALGDANGRLRWVEADLRDDNWPQLVGDEPFDAVLTTTALHWLSPAQLVTTYRNIANLLRPGGILLNADRLEFDERSPVCRALSSSLTKARWDSAFESEDTEDWDSWWASVAGQPTLDALLTLRQRRFAENNDHGKRTGVISSLALHTGALAEAGFHEIETIWQDLNRRLLLAVR